MIEDQGQKNVVGQDAPAAVSEALADNDGSKEPLEKVEESVAEEVFSDLAEVMEIAAVAQETSDPVETVLQLEVDQEENAENESTVSEDTADTNPDPATRMFEERQQKFLKGRRVVEDIEDDEGNVLVKGGTIIDEDVVALVRKHGKLVELIMNNVKQ